MFLNPRTMTGDLWFLVMTGKLYSVWCMPNTTEVLLLCILSSVFQSFFGKTMKVVDKNLKKK